MSEDLEEALSPLVQQEECQQGRHLVEHEFDTCIVCGWRGSLWEWQEWEALCDYIDGLSPCEATQCL